MARREALEKDKKRGRMWNDIAGNYSFGNIAESPLFRYTMQMSPTIRPGEGVSAGPY